MNRIDLDGRCAVITGGAQGIGRAVAERFLASGASVALWDRDEALLDEAHRALAGSGTVIGCSVDLTSPDQIRSAFNRTVAELGKVDILICNAGIAGATEPTWTYPIEEWRKVIDINLTGVFYCCRAFGRHMVAAKKGRIINIASDIGLRGLGQWTAYAASKGGVISLTKSLAWEWAPDVTVNALAPGAFLTDMNAPLREGRPGHTELVAESAALKRWGVPPEIGPVTVLMASGAMDFMTGSVVSIDGGTQQ